MPEPGVWRRNAEQRFRLLPLAARRLDLVEQVGPREPGDEGPRLAEVQLLDDVAAHPVGGRGGQGQRGRVAQQAAEVAQPGVVGAEVVPPLADAMGLVDRQQLDPRRADRIAKTPAAEPLRRHVNQAELAGRHPIQPRILLRRGQRAVDEAHRQTQRLKLIHLVLHQGDQRRDDQRQAIQGQGGQLVAEALSPAGRHHAQTILPGQDGRDDFLLPLAERIQAEAGQVGFRRGQADTSAVNQ